MATETTNTPHVSSRPCTGSEYLESLRDGREVWICGERVQDVTAHPAFRNAARMIARLYDALHAPATHDVLTCATDTGSGGYTQPDLINPYDVNHWSAICRSQTSGA